MNLYAIISMQVILRKRKSKIKLSIKERIDPICLTARFSLSIDIQINSYEKDKLNFK